MERSEDLRISFQKPKGNAKDRLSILIYPDEGSLATRALFIGVLSKGWYSWTAIGAAAAMGFVVTWPASYLVSRRIKRQDLPWDASRVNKVEVIIPERSAPEV